MNDYEQLGLFYLGRRRDEPAPPRPLPYLYDARDLVTHAVLVGMTGSGKTGLGLVLLEEAAIDGIPVIAIDPKGDLGNLLLTFPEQRAADFRPWIDEAEAARSGTTPDALAEAEAARWREGLAAWDQPLERIARLRSSAELSLYTPGGSAGRRLSLLRSFDPPSSALRAAPDAYRERLLGTTAGLLALAGLDDVGLESPAPVLVSALLDHLWSAGRAVTLEDLVHAVQKPPVERVGVMDVETFFPAKERFALAMRLNALLAGAGVAAWTEGEPLDVGRLLWSSSGKPRVAVLSIAHLGDRERMFFVTTLLSELVAWMRAQSGTSGLRALLYLDEAMGYLPPVANPPSKGPMLTLLKQARAFGLGVVIATQNPVDLDYKALSNAGTWFLGRLQTERDRLRVVDGLEAAARASGSFDRGRVERLVASLSPRVFLAVNAHDPAPTLFETRWALSYLRGPLGSEQIRRLVSPPEGAAQPPGGGTAAAPSGLDAAAASVGAAAGATAQVAGPRPALPPELRETFAPVRSAPPAPGSRLVYYPGLLAVADLPYASPKHGVDLVWSLRALTAVRDGAVVVDWSQARTFEPGVETLAASPLEGAGYAPLPREATLPKSHDAWQKAFVRWALQTQALVLLHARSVDLVSRPGESRSDFLVRVTQLAREERDRAVDDLQRKYAPKVQSSAEQLRLAEITATQAKQQIEQERVSAGFGIGSSIVGALLGRRVLSAANVERAGRAVRGAQRLRAAPTKAARAEQNVERYREKLRDLESALAAEVAQVDVRFRRAAEDVVELRIKPKKTEVHVALFALAWIPCWLAADGRWVPA